MKIFVEGTYFQVVSDANETWDKVKRVTDTKEFGVDLFREMFTVAPGAWEVFPWGRGDCQKAAYFDDPQFIKFAQNFVGMLDMAIGKLCC